MKTSKQESVSELPTNAVTISQYAEQTGYAVGYLYIKYQRALKQKKEIDYKIVSFKGVNFVIPLK